MLNTKSIAQHVSRIKNGIIKYVNVNAKIIKSAKNIIVRILAHVFVRIVNIYCWYFSDRGWWNYNYYGYCIKKNDRYCSKKCYEYCFKTLP